MCKRGGNEPIPVVETEPTPEVEPEPIPESEPTNNCKGTLFYHPHPNEDALTVGYDANNPYNSNNIYGHWNLLSSVSNVFMLKTRVRRLCEQTNRMDIWFTLLKRLKDEGWLIYLETTKAHMASSSAVKEVLDAGLEILAYCYADEPDLDSRTYDGIPMTQYLKFHYDRLKSEMSAKGIDCPLGTNWSLHSSDADGTWQARIEEGGIGHPPAEIIINDGIYCGADWHLHIAKGWVIDYINKATEDLGNLPIINIGKIFWMNEDLDNPEGPPTTNWAIWQDRLLRSGENSIYEGNHVPDSAKGYVLKPLPEEMINRVLVMGWYQTSDQGVDCDIALAQRPDIQEYFKAVYKPLGYTKT